MQLTSYTDYSLRVLIFLGSQPEGTISNINEISRAYGVSTHHLGKIVHHLGKLGLLQTIRGRNGGIRLALSPEKINIGWVVRQTEDNVNFVECFNADANQCIISPACRLKHVLNQALTAFLEVLDSYTLADLLKNQDELKRLFDQGKRC
ncbi:MAG: Rrf2 family transcriptional regulator [Bacillaceae bacterium]|nr:Rrf2 family transcriptional regulator [Bacillaceae bacterium]